MASRANMSRRQESDVPARSRAQNELTGDLHIHDERSLPIGSEGNEHDGSSNRGAPSIHFQRLLQLVTTSAARRWVSPMPRSPQDAREDRKNLRSGPSPLTQRPLSRPAQHGARRETRAFQRLNLPLLPVAALNHDTTVIQHR
jgi:hypothetical protein